MNADAAGSERVNRLKLKGDIAIAIDKEAIVWLGKNSAVERLGDHRLTGEFQRKLHCDGEHLRGQQP